MLHFLHAILAPLAVILLAIWVFFLFSLLWPNAGTTYAERRAATLIPFLCFLVVTVVAFIAWAYLVFA